MLEKLPHAVGHALQGVRPGLEQSVFYAPEFTSAPDTIRVTSSAFADNTPIPVRYTTDGEGVSPPLAWTNVPAGTRAVVLIMEDADSPSPAPLVHAIYWSLSGEDGELPDGALPSAAMPGDQIAMGKNSLQGTEYLPPDPPPGHGPHRYLFQVFALREPLNLGQHPGRSAIVEAMPGGVLARGLLTGIYERP